MKPPIDATSASVMAMYPMGTPWRCMRIAMTMNGRGRVVCAARVDRARRQRGRRQVSPDGGKGGEMRSGHIAGQCCIITGGMTSCSPAPTGGIISSPPTMWNEAQARRGVGRDEYNMRHRLPAHVGATLPRVHGPRPCFSQVIILSLPSSTSNNSAYTMSSNRGSWWSRSSNQGPRIGRVGQWDGAGQSRLAVALSLLPSTV
jgi:hypothetical protein